MLYAKSFKVLRRKGISMLTGLKVSSLTCRCVFYRPELNAKAGAHAIEFCKPLNTNGQSLRSIREKRSHLSSYHVYSNGL